jgi:hypothetical protein
MTMKAIVATLAFTIMGGMPALSDGSSVYAMKMDRCPYYPSPVVCRGSPRARTTRSHLTRWPV